MKIHLITGLFAGLATLTAYADCGSMPAAPDVANGMTATREEMVATQKAVKAFDLAVNEYVSCLQKNMGNLSQNKQDSSLAVLQRVADKFNTELRTFKKKDS